MARPTSKYPTELELEILKVLWREQPQSGRQIREALRPFRKLAYTSVMTVMGIMEEKGYVRRRKSDGSYMYFAKIDEQATTRQMLLDLVHRAYDGSVMSAVVNLLETSDIPPDELKQLRELIRLKSRDKESSSDKGKDKDSDKNR